MLYFIQDCVQVSSDKYVQFIIFILCTILFNVSCNVVTCNVKCTLLSLLSVDLKYNIIHLYYNYTIIQYTVQIILSTTVLKHGVEFSLDKKFEMYLQIRHIYIYIYLQKSNAVSRSSSKVQNFCY